MHDLRAGQLVERNGIAIAAPLGLWDWLGPRLRKRLRQGLCCNQRAGAAEPHGMSVAPDGVIPIDDPAARIHRGAHLADHRGTIRLPAMLLLAHPLHANGPARQRARNQSRVGGCVIGAVVPVTARPFHMDAPHLLDRHAQHLRNRLPVGVDALGVRPHRHCAVLKLGNCAGGTHGRVRLIGRVYVASTVFCAAAGGRR